MLEKGMQKVRKLYQTGAKSDAKIDAKTFQKSNRAAKRL